MQRLLLVILIIGLLVNIAVFGDTEKSGKDKACECKCEKKCEDKELKSKEGQEPKKEECKCEVCKDIRRTFFPLYSYKYNEKTGEKAFFIIPLLSGSYENHTEKEKILFKTKYSIPILLFWLEVNGTNVPGQPFGRIFAWIPLFTFYTHWKYEDMKGTIFNSLLFLTEYTSLNECKYFALLTTPFTSPFWEYQKYRGEDCYQYLEKTWEVNGNQEKLSGLGQGFLTIHELTGLQGSSVMQEGVKEYLKAKEDYKLFSIFYPFISNYKSENRKRMEVLPFFSYSKEKDAKNFTLIPLFLGWKSDKGLILEPKAILKWFPLTNYDNYLDRADFLWPLGDYKKNGNIEKSTNFDLLYENRKTKNSNVYSFGPFGILGNYKETKDKTSCNVLLLLYNSYKENGVVKRCSVLFPIYYFQEKYGEEKSVTKSLFPLFTYHKTEIKDEKTKEKKSTIIWPLLTQLGKDDTGGYVKPLFLFKIRY